MTEFWEAMLHVPVSGDAHFTWRVDYGDTIRRHALGRFDELLAATTTHPAMLIFLRPRRRPSARPTRTSAASCSSCTRSAPATTTRTTSRRRRGSSPATTSTSGSRGRRRTSRRTTRPARCRSRGSPTRTARATAARSPRSTSATSRTTPTRPSTSAERLATKFVRDDPPRSLVKRLAKVYLKNDTAIVPVLRALVASKEFRSSAGDKLRDPGEDVVATYRALGVDVGRPEPQRLRVQRDALAGVPAGPLPHAWPRPDGTPVGDDIWASPVARARLDEHALVDGRRVVARRSTSTTASPAAWVPAKKPMRFEDLVDAVSRDLLHRPATQAAWCRPRPGHRLQGQGEDRPRPRPLPVGLPAAAGRRPRLPRPPGVLT